MKKTKILLCFVYNDNMDTTMEEIGLSYIGSYLRKYGYEVKFDIFHESEERFESVRNFQPDIIGMPVYTMSKNSVVKAAAKMKQIDPHVMVVLGGVYATYESQNLLSENACIDVIIRGEGEETFLELTDQVETGQTDFSKIKGITNRIHSKIVKNADRSLIENIGKLPYPARDFLKQMKCKVAIISTSRGCYSRCSFCSSQLFWEKWRGIEEEQIVDEMEMLIKDYGIRVYNIIDGSFEDPDQCLLRAAKMAQIILNRQLNVFFFICVRAEIHRRVAPETLKLLIEAGLCSVCVGIESGNAEDLKLYKKIATVDDNRAILSLLLSHDITFSPGFISFNPFSTMIRLQENILFLVEYGFPIKFFTYLDIYKHTVIYRKVSEANLIAGTENGKYLYNYQDPHIGVLAAFFKELKAKLNENGKNYYNRMDYYAEGYRHSLIYYKRTLERESNYENFEQLRQFLKKIKDIYDEFNKFLGDYIIKALEHFEKNKSVEMLEEFTAQQCFLEKFASFVTSVDKQRDKINLFLTRNGNWDLLINV